MKTDELYRSYDVHGWLNYNPHEGHYAGFNPNVVATGFKISETYGTFCNARTLLASSESENFGDLSGNDEISTKYFVSTLLQSALATYNYCIDLSWQVVWFYCAPDDDYDLIDDEKRYISYCKKCTYDILCLKLKLGHRKSLVEHLDKFYSNELTKKLRSEYNYMKHRGSYHTPGLGMQRAHMMASINGEHLKLLTRNVFDTYEWMELLVQFDKLFTLYFNRIIDSIMPEHFKHTQIAFQSPLEYFLKKSKIL